MHVNVGQEHDLVDVGRQRWVELLLVRHYLEVERHDDDGADGVDHGRHEPTLHLMLNDRDQTYLERECVLEPFWQEKWQLQQARLFYKMA